MTNGTTISYSRVVARDIQGSDPERMAPPRVEEYVVNLFADTKIKVSGGLTRATSWLDSASRCSNPTNS